MAAGETLGQGVPPSWCRDPHVHIALVKTDTGTAIDPTGYLRKRKMPPPRWVQECDHYVLRWMVSTVSFGMPIYVSFQTRGCHAIMYNTNNDYDFKINISYHNI